MKTPYNERTELQKVQSQWRKLTGLHGREEWSAAIVRAATAADLAANFAIRKEFHSRIELTADFVDTLLHWANGLGGKTNHLLIPLSAGTENHAAVKKLKVASDEISGKRNSIAHQGEFCNEEEAKVIIQQTRTFIETLIQMYEPDFVLKDDKPKNKHL
jgi:hypothetical protein